MMRREAADLTRDFGTSASASAPSRIQLGAELCGQVYDFTRFHQEFNVEENEQVYISSMASIRALIERGASLDESCNNGTPLTHAAANGPSGLVQMLCDAGADLDIEDDINQWTAEQHARLRGDAAITQILDDARKTRKAAAAAALIKLKALLKHRQDADNATALVEPLAVPVAARPKTRIKPR